MDNIEFKRGQIWWTDLADTTGSEQGGRRPIVIIQNDVGNKHSPTVIVAAITGQEKKKNLPTHIKLASHESGLSFDSVVLLEQLRTLDKRRLVNKVGTIDMRKVDEALLVSLGLGKATKLTTMPEVGTRKRWCA